MMGPRDFSLRTSGAALCLMTVAACFPGPVRTKPVPEEQPPPDTLAVEALLTPEAALAAKSLIVPVQGVDASRVRDSYTAGRGGGRTHDAVDIMAARGTPVIAAEGGTILRLRHNEAGGITIYQLDPDERFIYYYAHLDRYQDGLVEGLKVNQGDILGFVGTTGNAPKDMPHLHFQVMLYKGRGQYWGGEPINPHPYLSRTGRKD